VGLFAFSVVIMLSIMLRRGNILLKASFCPWRVPVAPS
jgi:hypothetical protein